MGAGRMAPQDKSRFSRRDGGPWSMRQREAFVLREWLAARKGLTRVHMGTGAHRGDHPTKEFLFIG